MESDEAASTLGNRIRNPGHTHGRSYGNNTDSFTSNGPGGGEVSSTHACQVETLLPASAQRIEDLPRPVA